MVNFKLGFPTHSKLLYTVHVYINIFYIFNLLYKLHNIAHFYTERRGTVLYSSNQSEFKLTELLTYNHPLLLCFHYLLICVESPLHIPRN